MRFNWIFLGLSYLFSCVIANGQCPSTDFTIPSNACLNEEISPINNSSVGQYEWDFCSGDLSNTPSAQLAYTLSGANGRPSIEFAKDNGKWFGFVTGTFSNSLFRLEFGNGVNNVPTMTENLGDLGAALNGPSDIVVIKEGNKWYGLIYNANSGEIIKLDFGDKLSNPIIASLLVTNVGSFNSGFALGKDNANGWICIISNSITNQFTIIRLGDNLTIPTATDILVSPAVMNTNNLGDVDLIFDCGTWYGFAVNFGNGNLYRLNFGSQLFQIPVITQLNGTDSENGGRLKVLKEGESFFLMLPTLSGKFYKVEFGPDLSNPTPTIINEGNFGSVLQNSYGLGIAKDNSVWTMSVIDQGSGKINNVNYVNVCSVTIQNQGESPLISYSSPGDYLVSLTTTTSGLSSVLTRTVSISSLSAPDISFTFHNICAQHDVSFTTQNTSNNIANYDWNFGDGSSHMTSINPLKQFVSSGTYKIDLFVTATNGCKNQTQGSIQIYDQPSPAFIVPTGLICTNNEFTFTNNTIDNFDGNLVYQWYVNDIPESTDRNLKYTFLDGGDKNIKLKTTIPGCSDESSQLLNGVQTGPSIAFEYTGQCQGESIQFTNKSSGDIAGYLWDLGNGQTSTSTDITQTYSSGDYLVSLVTTGTNGCLSTTSKPLKIYSKPQPNFSLDLPPFSCAGTPSQFNDLTPALIDSNINGWNWRFGDLANGTDTNKNPSYTYTSSGDYSVSLTTTTDFGCSASIIKTVTISEPPKAGFTTSATCLNQSSSFTDNSTGSNKTWLWKIGNSSYTLQNPSHVFSIAGNYSAQLTVTGNNGCISVTSKPINVPVPPTLDFSSSNNCAEQATLFEDITGQGADPAVSRIWDFAGKGNGSGATTQFTFATQGTYNVKLTVKNQSGCSYALAKNAAIVTSPIADFTTSIESGPSPLNVQFTNASLNATSYNWRFNDQSNSTSLDVSPSFTYSSLGDFVVDLTAVNAQGCKDMKSKIIHVIIPRTEIQLEEFRLLTDPTTGSVRPIITIKNNSNYTINSLDVVLDIAGNAMVKEKINTTILSGASASQILNYELLPGASPLEYLCAELSLIGDTDLVNNSACISLEANEITFSPYPNPIRGELHFDWISPVTGTSNVSILNQLGQLAYQKEITRVELGLNQIVLDLSKLNPGVYILIFEGAGNKKTFPIVIQN